MKKWLKRIGWTLAAVLVGLCAGLYAVVPWSPFQESAGSLVGFVPDDVDMAVRLDPATLRSTPIVTRLANSPAFVGYLEDVGLEIPEAAAAAWPLLGSEVVLALRDDEWLALVRVTGLPHATGIALARRAAAAELTVSHEGATTVYENEYGETLCVERRADVFVVSPEVEIVQEAIACHAGGARPLSAAADYADALVSEEDPGGRVLAWMAPEFLESLLDGLTYSSEVIGPFGDELLAPDRVGAGRAIVHCGDTAVAVEVYWSYPSDPPPRDRERVVPSHLARRAARYASPGDVVFQLGLDIDVGEAPDLLPVPAALAEQVHFAQEELGEGLGMVTLRRADAAERSERSRDGVTPAPETVDVFYVPADTKALAAAWDEQEGLRRETVGPRNVVVYSQSDEEDGPAIALEPAALVHSSSRTHLLASLAEVVYQFGSWSGPAGHQLLHVRLDFAALANVAEDGKWEVVRVGAGDRLSEHGFRVRTMRVLHEEGRSGDDMKRELARRLERWRVDSAARRRVESVESAEGMASAFRTLRDLTGSLDWWGDEVRLALTLRAR